MKKYFCVIFVILMMCTVLTEQTTITYAEDRTAPYNVQIVDTGYGIGAVFEGTCSGKDTIYMRIYKDGVMMEECFGTAGTDPGNKYKNGALITNTMVENGPGIYTVGFLIKYKETGAYSEEVLSSNNFVYNNSSAPKLANNSALVNVAWDLNENYFNAAITAGADPIAENGMIHVEYAYNGFVLWRENYTDTPHSSNGPLQYISYYGNGIPQPGELPIAGVYEYRIWMYPRNPNLNSKSECKVVSTLVVNENGTETIIDGKYALTGFYYDGLLKYLQKGVWDSGFEGIVETNFMGKKGSVYVKDGLGRFEYNGDLVLKGKKYTLEGGWVVAVEDAGEQPVKNGIVYEDGVYHYYVNGRIDTSYAGLAEYNGAWWYVANGKIDFSFNGFVLYNNTWWCVAGGRVAFEYTGLWYDISVGWWYVENGIINFGYSGTACYDGNWYPVVNGQLV